MLTETKILKRALIGIASTLAVAATVFSVHDLSHPHSHRKPSGLDRSKFVHFDRLILSDFRADQKFLISNTGAHSRLTIRNEISGTDLLATLSCDQPFERAPRSLDPEIENREFNGDQSASFQFGIAHGKERHFLFGPKIHDCTLSYSSSRDHSLQGKATIQTETSAFPWISELTEYKDICGNLKFANSDSLDSFFSSTFLSQLNCPYSIQEFRTLETPESGFLAKTGALLGQELPSEFITNQNPYAPIDFSKAPKLKAIYLATLVYRADFYGTVMARLLKYHADHGTLVHIVTTGYMELDKDRALLYPLTSENPNFRLQEFKYYDPGNPLQKAFHYIDDRFRDMHIKLMVTLSDESEKDNAIIFGGRNIHDGFLFKTLPNYSAYPKLVQYGVEDDFVHWNDFEMKLVSRELAKTLASHLQRFINRDTTTETLEEFAIPGSSASPLDTSNHLFRHFISLPYSDDRALEDLYVQIIDSAAHSIHLSSPYLRPTPKILEALKRAANRRVEVIIQTRVELTGDTQAWLYEEVNKESINKLYQLVKIYRWKENSILHSKFLLVDGKVAIIGSVNLSRRSFIQDVENGFLIRSTPVVQKMEKIFDSYLEKSEQITSPEPRKALPTLLIRFLENQF